MALTSTCLGPSFENFLEWLRKNDTTGLDDVSFAVVKDRGLSCFADKDYAAGDSIFRIKQTCLIGLHQAEKTRTSQALRLAASALGERSSCTSELILWVYMCQRPKHFEPYLKTLDQTCLPDPSRWQPPQLVEALSNTNLGSTLGDIESHLKEKIAFLDRVRDYYGNNEKNQSSGSGSSEQLTFSIDDIPSRDEVSLEALAWARSHYLSRRYPGSFSEESSNITDTSNAPIMTSTTTLNSESDGREIGMSHMGCLCPLLDILNHSGEKDWLLLYVKDGYLCVDAKEPRPKGIELLSNYGSDKSNEQLLYAYGFAIEDNPSDAVTIKLMGGQDKTANGSMNIPQYIGTFYITRGGLAGVPRELWEVLSRYGWDEGDDDVLDDRKSVEGDDDLNKAEIAIGVEECLLLRDYLDHKLSSLLSTEDLCDKLFIDENDSKTDNMSDAYNQGNAIKRRRKEISSENNVGAIGALGNNLALDPRAHFIRYYRDGQRQILHDTLEELNKIIQESEELDQEGGDEEEEEEESEADT